MKHSSEWLESRLTEYAESGAYPFHMPGHKRNLKWETAGLTGDITEIDGFDDLHDPTGLLKEEMERAAAFYGTKETLFSVNGSTGAILAAISAAVPEGGRILAARNCHRSVFNAVYLRRLRAEFVLPRTAGAEWACAGGPVAAEDIEAVFQEEEQTAGGEPDSEKKERIAAVVVTSPTYDGIVSDIRSIADTVHRYGAVLIVDEAHGAHLGMHPYFPESAVQCGADLVVQSMHKTLPAMTQTALLHNVTGKVSSPALRYFMDIFITSSPSYVLMASMTSCLHSLENDGEMLFEQYSGRLKELREQLGALKRLELLSCGTAKMYDFSKLCIGTGTTGLTGPELYDLLRNRYGLQMEMKTPSYVLALTSCADTEEGFRRLAEALEEIDARFSGNDADDGTETSSRLNIYEPLYSAAAPEIRMTIAEAAERGISGDPAAEKSLIPGEICRLFLDCYPPGIPLLVPGETVPDDLAERIHALQAMGLTVRGAAL